MKKILVGIAVIVLGSIAVAYAMSELTEPETYSWRYKMTVDIDTPEGMKTGSAVREVSVIMHPAPNSRPYPYRPEHKIKGEAVVVDLEKRGKVFALLKGAHRGVDHGKSILFSAMPSPAPSLSPEGVKYYSQLKNTKVTLEEKHYPLLVMFKDMNDPKSIEPVYSVNELRLSTPNNPQYMVLDDMEKLFGQGVRLKNITIEITDEEVTWRVKDILSWLPDYYNMRFDEKRFGTRKTEYPFANGFASGAFSTGEKKQ